MPQDILDPLRSIEGFPIGEDADLHALSDPPHYTAYPNPHLAEFIAQWGTPYDEATDDYRREPYVTDVSEGKNDPIYNAHSYHTKVPYKAIIPFIEHYTAPGDIVFDGFCGTGMTGVAAQMAGRRAILCDLSPAATFIAYNYNTPVDVAAFELEARRILKEVEAECGWMYETAHLSASPSLLAERGPGGEVKGRINYTVWSDVFRCPYCHSEIVFWGAAVDADAGKVRDAFPCPTCGASVTKRELSRATETVYDSALGREIERARQVPVLINYSMGKKRYEKKPDAADLALIRKIEESEIPYWYPTNRMPEGDEARRNDPQGITHVHHFYTRRNLWILAVWWEKAKQSSFPSLFWVQTGALQRATLMHQLAITRLATDKPVKGGKTAGHRRGTLYMPSLQVEFSVLALIGSRVDEVKKTFARTSQWQKQTAITCQSTTKLDNLPANSVDYVYTDPPFGENIMYSELNFLWESWLRVFTNTGSEAIINKTQHKALDDYRELMTCCFAEAYRILKPGHWITVVFHNSQSAVWNAIQEAMAHAGFLVAQVTILDKVKKTHTQVTAAGSVKNDLVINAYKPRAGFTERFISQAGQGLEADFVRQHLAQLPVAANIERTQEMLYSKYLAYYVQRGYRVAYNGEQFYRALPQWGLEDRDGYWFSDEVQANDYEKRKVGGGAAPRPTDGKHAAPQQVLFISDEKSARRWLWNFLETPQTYSEIYTAFVKALQTSEDEIPELITLLEEGFIRTNGHWKRPDALTREELEARRQERLLRQFQEYLAEARAGRMLREVRQEVLLAGFIEAYRANRYADILVVGDRLPQRLREANGELRDFIEIAEAKEEK